MSVQNPLELRHLKTLRLLQETGSLRGAADKMHITQSALSHQLKELEARLGLTLFMRKSRPLCFTSAGLRLLELADELLPRVESAQRDLHRLAQGRSGRLRMAIECHSCYQWLLPAIDCYRQQWPEVEIDFSTGFNFAPLPALSRGELDLVVTADPNDDLGLNYQPLFKFEMLLALAVNHPLAIKRQIKPDDLAQQVVITYPVAPERLDLFTRFLDPAGVEPEAIRTCELTLMMMQLVASQRGVSALPNWALTEYLGLGQLIARPLGTGLWSTLYLAMRPEQQELPYIISFVEQARKICLEKLVGVINPSS